MNPRLRLSLACLLAVVTTVALLALLKLAETDLDGFQKPDLVVREINTAMPPPPPPPPPLQQPAVSSDALNLDVSGSGSAAVAGLVKSVAKTSLQLQAPPADSLNQVDWSLDWNQDWNVFGLGDLDQTPKLLTPVNVRFPASLRRRGIRRATAKMLIMIDESGKVTLKGFAHIDYPELEKGVSQVIKQARFTVPTKGGVPVRSQFIWPLELSYE